MFCRTNRRFEFKKRLQQFGFPDAAFDCIFVKGLTALQFAVTRTSASDHWPVTRNFRSR